MQVKRIGVACVSMAVIAFAACSDDDGNDEPGLEDTVESVVEDVGDTVESVVEDITDDTDGD